MSRWGRAAGVLAAVLVVDQVTKALVRGGVQVGDEDPVLPFLSIVHVRNQGVAFGFLELNSDDGSGDSFDANDSTVYGRVYLRAGAQVTGGIAGIEASWLSGGRLDFDADNAAGDLNEFYVGIFGAILF